MTEHEWETAATPNPLLHSLRPWSRRRRKLKLYVCAWCRLFWNRLNEPCRRLVNLVERIACGLEDSHQHATVKRAVIAQARKERREGLHPGDYEMGPTLLLQLRSEHLPGWEGMPPRVGYFDGTEEQRRRYEADKAECQGIQLTLLREVMGHPFRQAVFEPGWRTSTASALARGIYEDCTFDRMPLLADALQDAGCEDATVLAHCRGGGTHVRGCWVVDSLLGLE